MVSPITLNATQPMNTASAASDTAEIQFSSACTRAGNFSWNTSTRMWLRPMSARLKAMVEPTASA